MSASSGGRLSVNWRWRGQLSRAAGEQPAASGRTSTTASVKRLADSDVNAPATTGCQLGFGVPGANYRRGQSQHVTPRPALRTGHQSPRTTNRLHGYTVPSPFIATPGVSDPVPAHPPPSCRSPVHPSKHLEPAHSLPLMCSRL